LLDEHRLAIYVTKADGSKQVFDKEKIVQTCQRIGANREVAIQVAQEVEKNLYPDITTQQSFK
jgi:transcriptional regulator NrdR family protein